jgi:hypothetical protein
VSQLFKARQGKDEKVADWIHKIQTLGSQFHEAALLNCSEGAREGVLGLSDRLRNICFIQGLASGRIQTIVRSRNYQNFDEMVRSNYQNFDEIVRSNYQNFDEIVRSNYRNFDEIVRSNYQNFDEIVRSRNYQNFDQIVETALVEESAVASEQERYRAEGVSAENRVTLVTSVTREAKRKFK